MQKTILSISKNEHGPVAIIYDEEKQLNLVTNYMLAKALISVLLSTTNVDDIRGLDANSTADSLILLNVSSQGLTILAKDGEISNKELVQKDILDLIQLAMIYLTKNDYVSASELKTTLQRKKDWDNISSMKLPI